MEYKGRVWIFGDDVSTDLLMPADVVFGGKDPDSAEVALTIMRTLKPALADGVQRGDIVIAGKNFGCGSGRPAARILRALGISAVVADSAARMFFRNAVHIGLPVLLCPGAGAVFEDGNEAYVDLTTGVVKNLSKGIALIGEALPPQSPPYRILAAGGIDAFAGAGGWGREF